jgi:hypothetical protein
MNKFYILRVDDSVYVYKKIPAIEIEPNDVPENYQFQMCLSGFIKITGVKLKNWQLIETELNITDKQQYKDILETQEEADMRERIEKEVEERLNRDMFWSEQPRRLASRFNEKRFWGP